MPRRESLIESFGKIRSDYDAAKKNRFKRRRTGLSSMGSGADYHYRTETEFFGMMEQARDLFRNHCLIGQGIRRLCANVLRGGFNVDPKTGDKKLNADLKARWDEWAAEADLVDIKGEHDFHEYERLTLQTMIVDGDLLTLPTKDGTLQAVEAHRLRTPSRTKRNVVHGVLVNEFRKPLEYWITKDEIDPLKAVPRVSDITPYKARDSKGYKQVLHHYLPDRFTQTRGVTAFAPAIDTSGMGDDLMFAQLVKAQMSACITLFRELAETAEFGTAGGDLETTTEARPSGTTRTLAEWTPGLEIFGFPGEKLVGFSPNVPNTEFFQHAMLILTIVAVNLDLPLPVFLLDPTKTNFSGWRGAIDQARERFQEIQRGLIKTLHRPVYRWKLRQWLAEDPALRAAAERERVNFFKHVWKTPAWPYIEPTKDSLGDVIQERNLLTSHRRLAANRGLDFEEIGDELVEDRVGIIIKAHNAAKRLNKMFGEDEEWVQVNWQVIAQWPMPEGISISVGTGQAQQPSSNGDEEPSAFAALERVNGSRV